MSTQRCGIPSFWSCGLIVGILFCLINKQINAFPLEDTQIEKSAERSKRSVSDQLMDQMALDWFLKRGADRKGTLQKRKSRASRSIADQILAEMEAQWYEDKLGGSDAAAHPSSARTRRFAIAREEEEEERAQSRRSFADQQLAHFLVRHRLNQAKAQNSLFSRLGAGSSEGGGGGETEPEAILDFDRLG